MEHSKNIEYKVGIFVFIATLLALVFIMLLGGDKAFTKRDVLHLKVEETFGLAVGAMVDVSGIPAGYVSAIRFDEKSNGLDVELRVDHGILGRITRGSLAVIHTQGALGDKYVTIKPGAYSGPPVNSGDTLETESNSDFLSTLGKSGDKFQKVFDILDNVEKLVRNLNERNTGQNLGEAVRNLRGSTASLDEVLASVRGNDPKNPKLKKFIDHLESIFAKIDNGEGTLGGLINDPTVHEDLKEILGGAKRSKILKYLIRQAVQTNEDEEAKQHKAK